MKTFYLIMIGKEFLTMDLTLTNKFGDAMVFTDIDYAKSVASIIEEDATVLLVETNISFKQVNYNES